MCDNIENIITTINNDIAIFVKQKLSPLFEAMINDRNKMRMIETILKEMPEFKRIEKENQLLKLELDNIKQNNNTHENTIKLEIKETLNNSSVMENEIYNELSSGNSYSNDQNKVVRNNDEVVKLEDNSNKVEASEVEYETEAEEEEASEVEASEAEEEASEAEEEASEAEEEASEAEEEEEEEEEAIEADEEAEASEADEEAEASEADEESEEVVIVEIKGRGNFYTTNEQNGDIYTIQEDEDVGDLVGKFVNGVAKFN